MKGTEIFSSEVPPNAPLPISATQSGTAISLSDEQPLKALPPIFSNIPEIAGKDTEESDLQFSNAPSSRLISCCGKLSSPSEAQPANALSPIVMTELSVKPIFLSEVQPANALTGTKPRLRG